MRALQVRDFPEHLYQQIVERAAVERRSISQETIILLEKALGTRGKGVARAELLDQIVKETREEQNSATPDPAILLREDRDR